ncbi:MAG: hypothetical protein NXY57DRAFT_668452 [Lentinula lateritia]|nr:MAG: hypothetical protein NXY57DRAFT_668452 [Lentinula lateritia]
MDPSVQTSYADIQATFGPLLLGGLGAAILTGMIIAQGFNYLKSNTDPSYVRCMVGVIIVLDILHLVTLCLGLWMWFIKLHEATVAIFIVPFAISVLPKLTRFNDFELIPLSPLPPIFCRYLWYSQLLRRSSPTASLPGEYSNSARRITGLSSQSLFPQFRRYCPWALTVALALSAGVDVVITIMMMILLRQSRAKSLSLNDVINSLFVLTLENGAITSLAAIICMILWLTMNNFVFLGLYFIIGKLYGNSILAVLNYRKHLPRTRNDGLPTRFRQGSTIDLNVVRFSGSHGQPSPVPTKSRLTNPRSFLHIPAQICNSMKDKRAYIAPPPEKTFGIIVERSVEHDFS